jgi:rhodanese-related sulfurtransferase
MVTMTDTQKAVEYFEAKLEFTTGPAELNSKIERDESINIIDVRREEDYRKGHIPGAINLPKSRWDSLEGLSRDRTNVVYCYTQQCHLAASACKFFAEHGFPVMELEGGFEAWRAYPLTVEK